METGSSTDAKRPKVDLLQTLRKHATMTSVNCVSYPYFCQKEVELKWHFGGNFQFEKFLQKCGKENLPVSRMPLFKENRDSLLLAHSEDLIDDEEFALLYDLNTSKNPDYPYWKYEPFNLESLSDSECKTEFRFYKADVYRLAEVLHIPDEIRCYNRLRVDGIEAFCVFLKRFAYPIRYADMIPRFGRPVPQLSMISNQIMDMVYQQHHDRLTSFNQPWLSQRNLALYANSIHNAGAPLENCWGFVDGTVRPVCRPSKHQRLLYNGHKRIHAIKFQSVVAPNGLIANLYGPVEGRRHDSGMLAESRLLTSLQEHSFSPNGQPLCIYGDPAYPMRIHLQAPFKGARLTPIQQDFNKAMSQVRISVEWVFGDIIDYFAFLDFRKNLKVGLSAVGKMYAVCALLTNARTCLYKSITSRHFELDPPVLESYFQ